MSNRRIRIKALQQLERSGGVTAERLVQAAKNARHVLHRDFTWDDAIAGHKYRLEQAREIISSVRVQIVTSTQRITSVAYVRDPRAGPHQQGYVSVAQIRSERQLCEEVMLSEVTRVQAALERCREVAGALDLSDEVEAALSHALTLRSRIRRGPAMVEDRVGA
jgi:hypothetical protein